MWNLMQINRYTKYKHTHRHKTNLCLPKGKEAGRDKLGVWDKQKQITTHKIDKQQGFAV